MKTIIALTIVLGGGVSKSYVTKECTTVSGDLVHYIRNMGSEFENSIHSEYHMLDESGNLIACVENCPIIVEYAAGE